MLDNVVVKRVVMILLGLIVSKLPFCCHGNGMVLRLGYSALAGFMPVLTSRRRPLQGRYAGASVTGLHLLMMV